MSSVGAQISGDFDLIIALNKRCGPSGVPSCVTVRFTRQEGQMQSGHYSTP